MNSSPVMIVVLVIAVIAIAAIAFGISRKRRSQKLRERFGPEYDRVVKREGDVRKGEGPAVIPWAISSSVPATYL